MSVTSSMKSWLRRSSLTRQRKRRRGSLLFGERRLAGFETLEPRQLLAADFLFDAVLESREGFDLKLSSDGVAIQLRDALTGAVVKTQPIAENSGAIVVTGSSASETLSIDDSAREFSVLFDAGAGIDSLKGPASNAVWNIEAIGSGQLDDFVQFVGVENLIGGPGIDVFIFDDGASITGTLDGGLGSNGLDYSAYESAVTIDLAGQTATGTGTARNISNLTGGTGSDTLYGLAVDSVWRIREENTGTIEFDPDDDVIRFSGIENLVGADTTSDSFILEADGSLEGTLRGGAGGLDSLVIRQNTVDEQYALVNVANGDAASITKFGKTIRFEGLEPIVGGTASARVISGSSLPDSFRLESVDSEHLQIVSVDINILDVSSGTLVSSLSFLNPADSLEISLGRGNDQLTLGVIDAALTASIAFDGGHDNDFLVAADTDNVWNIAGQDRGSLNGVVSYTRVENLVGGLLSDRFVYADLASITGAVDGGSGGVDTLDYSDYASGKTIQLRVGNFNIDQVVGGAGTDTLVGIIADNVWTIDGSGAGNVASTVILRMPVNGDTVVDAVLNVLRFPYVHPFSTGDVVTYSSTLLFDSSGLAAGTYYVLVVDEQAIKLTSTAPMVAGLRDSEWTHGTRRLERTPELLTIPLDGSKKVDGYASTITFGTEHGLADGDRVTYVFEGASDNSQLVNQAEYIVLVIDSRTVKLLTSAPTIVPLSASSNWSTGTSSLARQEQISTVAFSGIESLQGRSEADAFVFSPGGQVAGTIDGGSGENVLDYSAFTDVVTVNLARHGSVSMTGSSGVRNIDHVIGGANNADRLLGPDQKTVWEITGLDAGRVNAVAFSGFEILVGADNTQDGFILRAGGSVTGMVDGGANGRDGLAIEDPSRPGDLAVIVPHSTGNGTLAANAVYPGVGNVVFRGMEQPFYLDTSVPNEITLRGTAFDDTLSFSQSGSTLIVTETATGRYFWDFASEAFIGKSRSFTVEPTVSARAFRARLDDGDSVNVVGFDPGQATALEVLDAGQYRFSGNVFTHGGAVKIGADTIIVDAGVTISTRATDVVGVSVGDSGNIELTAETITINDGAELLSFDNRADTTSTAGVPASIDAIVYPPVVLIAGGTVPLWKPGYVFRNIKTATSGAGTGMAVDLVVDKAGAVGILLHDPGAGYADGDAVWVELAALGADAVLTESFTLLGVELIDLSFDLNLIVEGGSAAKVATFAVDGLLGKGGDISLLAINHEFVQGAFYTVITNAQVDIHNAYLHGRNVTIRADANNHDVTTVIDTIPEGTLGLETLENLGNSLADSAEALIAVVSKYRPFVGVGLLDAEARVTIGEGTRIIADADAKISAVSDSQVLLDVISDLIGVGYAHSVSNAKVEVESDVTIVAAGNVELSAWSDNASVLEVQVGGDLLYGKIRGLSGTPFGISVAISDAQSDATVNVHARAIIHAIAGDVTILAVNTKNLQTTAIGSGEYKVVAASWVWSTGTATASAIVNGNVTSDKGDVKVQSLTSSSENLVDAYAQIGATLGTKLKRKGAAAVSNLNPFKKSKPNDFILSQNSNPGEASSPGRLASFLKGVSQSVSGSRLGKLGSWLSTDNGEAAEKFKTFGGSFTVGYTDHFSSATSTIGENAVVAAGVNVFVLADVIDRPEIIAAADVTSGQATQEREFKETTKKYAGAVSIIVAEYTNQSLAEIRSGATVDTNRLGGDENGVLTVQARTFLPYDFPLERYTGLGDFFSKLGTVVTSRNFGATTSWAKASAASDKGSITGSFNLITFDPSATATIASNAKINQGVDAAPSDVTVRAETESQVVNFVDDPLKIAGVVKGIIKDPTASSGGGSFSGVFYSAVTQATVDAGARVDAANLLVEAKSDTTNVSFGIAGSNTSGVSVNGVVTYADINNSTLAQVSNAAIVEATGSVKVIANDDLFNANAAGGISLGRIVGIGITGAGNRIIRNTRALIGYEEVALGRGEATPSAGVDRYANTIDLGYVHGFATGDSVRYSSPGDEGDIRGLVDGDLYYIRVLGPTVVALARSAEEAAQSAPKFGIQAVSSGVDQIALGYAHGFQTGDAVVYDRGAGGDLAGLENGRTYFVIRIDSTTVKLAESKTDAADGNAFNLDTVAYPGTGTGHSLRLDLDTTGVWGSQHNLGRTFSPLTAVVSAAESIDLGQPHGFTLGQAVVYRSGGGTRIGGLIDGGTYYVVPDAINPNAFQLAGTEAGAQKQVPEVIDLTAAGATGTRHGFAVAFDAADSVDDSGDTIDLGYNHGLRGGDLVVYDNGGGTSITGLSQGGSYYVTVVGDTAVKLVTAPAVRDLSDSAWSAGTRTLTPTSGNSIRLDGTATFDGAANSITFASGHGLSDDDRITYGYSGAGDTSGLVSGTSYRVLVVDLTTIKLLTAPLNYVAIDGSSATGVAHTLRLPIAPATALTDAPLSAVDTIDLGYPHGFATGQRVFYSHGGGDSIGGLAHKNEYFVIRVSDTVIRLATTGDNATNGVWIDLDTSVATGTSHAIGVPFRAVQVVDSTADTIYFDGVHTYRDGEAVVYDNGGGTNIGGLMHELTYYVTRIDSHTIQLSTDPADRSGSVVNLDGTVATGTGHTLLGPSGFGSVTSGGAITVQATNTGTIGTGTLAAAGTKTAKADASATAKETPAGNKWGIAVSGSVSVNIIDDTAQAYLRRAVVVKSDGLDVRATNDTDNTAISGAFALSFNKSSSTSVALAGAVTVNVFDNRTQAFIENSTLTDAGVVTVTADATGNTVAIAAGLGVSANGYGLAGSVAINSIDSDTQAYLTGGSITAASLRIAALDTTSIIAVAGAIAYGGKAGIGAGFAYNTINGGAQAWLSSADVDVTGAVVVKATNNSQITAVAAAIAVAISSTSASANVPPNSRDSKSFALALAAGVSINTIDSETTAKISGSGTVADPVKAGSLTVTATDTDSRITGVGGGIAVGLSSLGSKKAQGNSTALAAGASFVFNDIDSTVEAVVEDAVLSVSGDLIVTADAAPEITALAIAGAFAGAMGSTKSNAFAGAGSVTVNTVSSKIGSRLRRSRVTTTNAGKVRVAASDDSTITADAGGVALSIAIGQGSQGSSLSVAVGAAVAFNRIEGSDVAPTYVEATVDGSFLSAAGAVEVTATSTTDIDALTLAGAGAVGGSGGGGGTALSGAGAVSENTIDNNIEAHIRASNVTAGNVLLTAHNGATIDAETYGFSVAVGASSGKGSGGSLSVGVSLAYNTVDASVLAFVDDSSITTTSGSIGVSSTNSVTITAVGVAASLAASASGSGSTLAVSGGGAVAKNVIGGAINAYVQESEVSSAAGVSVTASNTLAKIDATVVAASVSAAITPNQSAGSASIGVAVSLNEIGVEAGYFVKAYVDNSKVTSAGDIEVTADSKPSITAWTIGFAMADGKGGGGFKFSGAGSVSLNTIHNTTEAYILDSHEAGGIFANGGAITLSATDDSEILAIAGALATAGLIGGSDNAVSGGISVAENEITSHVRSFVTNSIVHAAGDLSLTASQENAKITAYTVGGAIARSKNSNLAVGATVASNTITADVKAYISNSTDVVTTAPGSIKLEAKQLSTITAYSVAASIAVSTGDDGFALSGGGAKATNEIFGNANAYLLNSAVTSGKDVSLTATSNSTIDATVVGLALAGSGGPAALAIGVSLATNTIGTIHGDGTATPFEVRAYVQNSSINASSGNLTQTATSASTITSTVVAASAAVTTKSEFGVGLGGAGADSTNRVATWVQAAIDGDSTAGIHATGISLTADDTSKITAITVGASLAASVASEGAAIAVGVSLSENEISNTD
jgi:hypothetical protein